MKTKIIPFDLETAKDISKGKIKGKIKTNKGYSARIICWDRKDNDNYPGPTIVALYDNCNLEIPLFCNTNGKAIGNSYPSHNLVLELPDNEPQFKPFDKVLVYNRQNGKWFPNFFSHIASDGRIVTITNGFYESDEVVNYEGNEHLVGTTDKPKED